MGKVDPDDPQPPYLQVADDLRTAIHEGVLAAGQRLPKQADLVEEYGVSLGTVKSALAVLRDESLIISRQGEGSWVRRTPVDQPEPADEDEPDTRQMLGEVLDRLTEISRRLEAVEQHVSRS
ncbi:GntR family transcriptional regulator [Halopolyspora algeriensis]|uniref:GntR family transcriptional regulator n=1 Tax=Halopolyspora algeriensis TaxID=1500506 RepID=UPI000DF3C748|nr:GntR family transcriptional regulator [Halopolyspora algeriensis]